MKKLAIIFAAIAVLAGCEKPAQEPTPQDVNITITYSLDTSVGSDMTKATDAEVFDMFYQKMKTGELVAPSYNLTFTETATGAKYEFSGDWADKDMITIRTGKYKIEGTSTATGNYIQQLASIKFDEEVEISTSSSSITLKAIYDCFLLAFAKSDITSLVCVPYQSSYVPDNQKFFTLDDYYYAFVNDKLYSVKSEGYIKGNRGQDTFKIMTGNATFEKGKYYIYNDVSGSFELPKMEAGE